ncbi:DUF4404 family protein [Entomomonas sp. E2T0]|uniref:DUF4404 family protein n=1 Tax=Entomomonas sp. E2T0 TaxID=2930213 RepID=UPI0022284716|nr:DUF4404 family protein [Entomomonas sp. E2T0]UYZ82636.1 DUF4404 family protein [Entomomonas sp. E2T0]
MSKTVHENLIDLQYKLNHAKTNTTADKEEIERLAEKINHQLELEKLGQQPDINLVEELGLAVGEFEAEHPTLSAALRNIMITLQNIGI